MNSLFMAPFLINTSTGDIDYNPNLKINNIYKDDFFRESLFTQIIPISIYKQPPYYKDLIESVVNQFMHELVSKIDVFGKYSADIVTSNFLKSISHLIFLNPSKIGIELTSLGSIYIVSEINSKNIYLELFFKNELNLDVEAVLNVYENKQQILTVNGTINQIIKELNENLNKKPIYFFNPSLIYELSSSPSTCQPV